MESLIQPCKTCGMMVSDVLKIKQFLDPMDYYLVTKSWRNLSTGGKPLKSSLSVGRNAAAFMLVRRGLSGGASGTRDQSAKETVRFRMLSDQLPQYLGFSVLALARRFSRDPFYENEALHTAERYALEAWREVVLRAFDTENGPNHQLVQAADLLALYDFTGISQHSFKPRDT